MLSALSNNFILLIYAILLIHSITINYLTGQNDNVLKMTVSLIPSIAENMFKLIIS